MAEDVVEVRENTVACQGNGPVSGHPLVYLTFAPGASRVVCPYCSRTFALAPAQTSGTGH